MTLLEQFAPYRNAIGLYDNKPGEKSGNMLLYSAEYIAALAVNGELTPDLQTDFYKSYMLASDPIYPGLMRRQPDNSFGQESVDDYVGCGTASATVASIIASDILAYGQQYTTGPLGLRFRYVYNNIKPDVFTFPAWLGRQPQVIAHLMFAAGWGVPLWRKLWWCASVLLALFAARANQDAHTLTWHLCRAADGKSRLCQPVIRLWRWRFMRRFPGGVGQVIGENFGDPKHPLAQALWGVC